MGKDYIDIYTYCHFLGGIAYRLVVFPDNEVLSFIVSMFIHILGELVEHPVHPITKSKETNKNHIGDLFSFILGWLVGCYINPYFPSYNYPLTKNARFWLLIIIIFLTLQEFLRELIITENSAVAFSLYPQINGVFIFGK